MRYSFNRTGRKTFGIKKQCTLYGPWNNARKNTFFRPFLFSVLKFYVSLRLGKNMSYIDLGYIVYLGIFMGSIFITHGVSGNYVAEVLSKIDFYLSIL